MAEKESVFQTVQLGVETTPGTAVAANRKLLAASMKLTPRVESENFRAEGNKYSSFVVLNKEWTEVGVEGKPTYNEIVYLLSSLLRQPTPAQQGGSTAYLWTFDSLTAASDAAKTFTAEQGDADSAWRSAGVRLTGLELGFSRNEVTLNGSGVGKALETGITLTASPTSLTPLPLLPAQLAFKMATTRAGLAGATALTRGFSASWSLTDKATLAWPVGQDPIMVEGVPNLEGRIKLATNTTGMGLLATMRAGTTQWFRITAVGALIASTYYNTVEIDFPAQIMDVGEFADDEGIYMVEYGLAGIHDATWGKAFEIRVTNAVSTL